MQSFANFLFIVVNMVLRSDDSRYIVISATVLTIYPVLATALRFISKRLSRITRYKKILLENGHIGF